MAVREATWSSSRLSCRPGFDGTFARLGRDGVVKSTTGSARVQGDLGAGAGANLVQYKGWEGETVDGTDGLSAPLPNLTVVDGACPIFVGVVGSVDFGPLWWIMLACSLSGTVRRGFFLVCPWSAMPPFSDKSGCGWCRIEEQWERRWGDFDALRPCLSEDDVSECARLRVLVLETSGFSAEEVAAGAVLGRDISGGTRGGDLVHGE